MIKVYIDTSIISRHFDARIKPPTADALEQIAKSSRDQVSFVISTTVDREIENAADDARRALLLFVARLSDRVEVQPHQFAMRGMRFLTSGQTQVRNWRDVIHGEAPLYAELRKIFDETDAEHIFRAIKSGCDYFLTLDHATILDRIAPNQAAVDQLCGSLQIVSPHQLAARLPS